MWTRLNRYVKLPLSGLRLVAALSRGVVLSDSTHMIMIVVKCLKLMHVWHMSELSRCTGCLNAAYIRACVVINLWIMTNYVIKSRNVPSYQTFVRSILHVQRFPVVRRKADIMPGLFEFRNAELCSSFVSVCYISHIFNSSFNVKCRYGSGSVNAL
jgi:hypothetical protein